jgi:hypothetical protein
MTAKRLRAINQLLCGGDHLEDAVNTIIRADETVVELTV